MTLGVVFVLLLMLGAGQLMQRAAQRDSITTGAAPVTGLKQQREVDKLTAQVKQIRSDTSGSLYWLKLAGIFVTVGAAVGGFLIAQSKSSRERVAAEEVRTNLRIDFDRRVQVDTAFQTVVQELSSSDSTLLRATAAMKLGKLLQAPPVEWQLETARRDELWSLTKQILAASLAIESDPKVLKALTIAIALHAGQEKRGNLRGLDFSLAHAADAYWADVDFTSADFYRSNLASASLRRATLSGAQFRETVLAGAVLSDAVCHGTNFKLTDLRHADLSGADLSGASFEGSKVHAAALDGAKLGGLPEHLVDLSPGGDGSQMVAVSAWVSAFQTSAPTT